jgi:hypothetical protein
MGSCNLDGHSILSVRYDTFGSGIHDGGAGDGPVSGSALLNWLIGAILALTVVEGLGLWTYDRVTRRGLPSRVFLLNWASGVCLLAGMLSLGLGGNVPQVMPWLLAAGLLHAWDLKRNWRRSRRRAGRVSG